MKIMHALETTSNRDLFDTHFCSGEHSFCLVNTSTDENLVLYLQEEIKQLRYQLQKLMSKRRDHRLDEENARLREAVRFLFDTKKSLERQHLKTRL